MKREKLLRFLPYEVDYTILHHCRSAENIGLWIIGSLSILSPMINSLSGNSVITFFQSSMDFLNFIFIIAYYVLTVVTETFLYPETAGKRRRGFLDNSLGTKYLPKPTTGYYSNDNVKLGAQKIIVNGFENCFFSYNIAKAMLPEIIIKNSLFILGFLSVAYFGFNDRLVALPMLQILFSSLFITELIHHVNFVVKLKILLDKFTGVVDSETDEQRTLADAILLILDYETTLAYNKAPFSDSVYENMKEKLTEDWEELKKRYEI